MYDPEPLQHIHGLRQDGVATVKMLRLKPAAAESVFLSADLK